jgi:hypothetical protein
MKSLAVAWTWLTLANTCLRISCNRPATCWKHTSSYQTAMPRQVYRSRSPMLKVPSLGKTEQAIRRLTILRRVKPRSCQTLLRKPCTRPDRCMIHTTISCRLSRRLSKRGCEQLGLGVGAASIRRCEAEAEDLTLSLERKAFMLIVFLILCCLLALIPRVNRVDCGKLIHLISCYVLKTSLS